MSLVVAAPEAVVDDAHGTRVAEARARCATSMQAILRGDVARVHPFVLSLLAMLTLDMPDPRDKAAFVRHVSLRTACVLGDLFALARGEEEPTLLSADAAPPQPPASAWVYAQFPLCVVLGAILSGHLTLTSLCAGCFVHPEVVGRVGLPWCVLACALLVRAVSLGSAASLLLGVLAVDARCGFKALRRATGGWQRSSTRPAPS